MSAKENSHKDILEKAILDKDRQYTWHPFTQHQTEPEPIPIARAEGAYLYATDGTAYLDLISSWWATLHGHNHPRLVAGLKEQADTLDHVMFAGFTHQPAVELAEALANKLPGDLQHTFFSDNGSTAVEVALKLAYQYWRNLGEHQRTLFLGFEGAYHGDTFGAMAMGQTTSFFRVFQDLFFEARHLPYPATWDNDEAVLEKEEHCLAALEKLLVKDGHRIAAMILEPLMQGASGMRIARPSFVRKVVEAVRKAEILVIFDEIATGFGRTGDLFACETIGVTPDIICLSKGLTGGMLPLSVTICQPHIFDAFLAGDFSKAFTHGHTFTANPLSCAVALASLKIFEEENTLEKIQSITRWHQELMGQLSATGQALNLRQIGTVMAFEPKGTNGQYKADIGEELKEYYLAHGLNIRPLGNTVYLIPPYCITQDELARAYEVMAKSLIERAEPPRLLASGTSG